MTRPEILDTAKKMVCGEREGEYGSPENNFAAIARRWNAHVANRYPDAALTLDALDVALMMTDLKQARIETGTAKEDSFVDAAGYIACGGEIATGAPAADVAVVVHGEWILLGKNEHDYETSVEEKCSLCGRYVYCYDTELQDNYCPNCGAKMDKEDET